MENWEEFFRDLVDRILSALDHWCHNVSGDSSEDCYSAHADRDLYELAEEFVNWSHFGITEWHLEKLREAPDDIYEKYNELVQNRIWEVVERLTEGDL